MTRHVCVHTYLHNVHATGIAVHVCMPNITVSSCWIGSNAALLAGLWRVAVASVNFQIMLCFFLCVCMCTCICVYVSVYIHVCLCMFVHICMFMCLCTSVYVCVCMHACVCLCVLQCSSVPGFLHPHHVGGSGRQPRLPHSESWDTCLGPFANVTVLGVDCWGRVQ